jgi:hypothetical protein
MICPDGCIIKNNCGPLLALHLSDLFHRSILRKLDDERVDLKSFDAIAAIQINLTAAQIKQEHYEEQT